MFGDDQETIYRRVPKWVDDALNEEQGTQKLINEIKSYYGSRRTWFTEDINELEGNVQRFKAVGQIHKAALEEALASQDEVFSKLHDSFAKQFDELTVKAKEVKRLAASTKETVDAISRMNPDNQLYKAERLFKVVEVFNSLDKKSKELLGMLLVKDEQE